MTSRRRRSSLWLGWLACLWLLPMAQVQAQDADANAAANAAETPDDDEATPTETKRVAATVVEIAGGRVYISPGADAGITRGVVVRFGERGRRIRAKVVSATASYAVVDIDPTRTRVGAKVVAMARLSTDTTATALPTPSTLDSFRGQWPRIAPLAEAQHPRYVPLGRTHATSNTRGLLSLQAGAIIPTHGPGNVFVQGGLRGRVHWEPWSNVPLAVDADLTVQGYAAQNLSARPGQDSRPLLFARELSARYGTQSTAALTLGRMRYASQANGMLDGARAQVAVR